MSTFHQRYLTDSVGTASPGRLLVMLYDRLSLDLERGAAALREHNREAASNALVHAQDILLELRASLRLDQWDGAQQLADLYSFLIAELMRANTRQDADAVTACLRVVEPLRDAWREAVDSQQPTAMVGRATA
jgi:flagellar secretion chaperone FliS